MNDNINTVEKGYAIKVTSYYRNGNIYREGYYGEHFYVSPLEAELYEDKSEAREVLNNLKKEYNDGTVEFKLYKLSREVKVQAIKI